jgi:hypothetical protein
MAGILVFSSLQLALREGYQVCNHTEDGYQVRIHGPHGWEMALVDLKSGVQPR